MNLPRRAVIAITVLAALAAALGACHHGSKKTHYTASTSHPGR
jgi:hypothetical protein